MKEAAPYRRIRRGGFPLAILFLFFTMAIVWGAMLSAVARSLTDWESVSWVAFATASTTTAAVFLGAFVGLFHYRRRRGVVIGIMAGLVAGIVAGPLLSVNAQGVQMALGGQIAGSLLIVITAAFLRMLNRDDPGNELERDAQ